MAIFDSLRIGFGEDAHRLAQGRPLVLGGVAIANAERGAVAHSDGDALLHALSDALLSALALGDIGQHFPDTSPEWKDLDSTVILRHVLDLVSQRDFTPVNVAVTVTLDRPKLGASRAEIAERVAQLLRLTSDRVGVTFKTSEGLAPDHVQARATVLLARSAP
ncbi:2-C-methyl-D-erythritol 2,4-cyclodiphosphate synthase [Deinococcus yavapaiensis]|uniref:2-C-methyl-D-erythritol 2,4-cyclodiphosphate synthase n=1 Tax=Deinococcus yavapaiensis KR-236 TaxID=694435 RepID=A0A318SB53_9DEIO|nr:2-C-methyl-D-erythritol 2,4-cyclodiphosphate synthase [Deinococcus yavapaiensis]PYE55802.1 2-C-methyl-D-erythritol 2,4-cyclodiphosphate synthase [Deinococcus yavapaiensis KR-236]